MKQRFTIKEASIAFTGHRNIAPEQQDKVRERLRKAVSLAYKEGKYQCICGMALGFDMLAAEEVLSLKARLPYLQLIAVVPFRGQNSRWDLAEQQRYDHILAKADKVIVLSDTYYKGCPPYKCGKTLSANSTICKNAGSTLSSSRYARKPTLSINRISNLGAVSTPAGRGSPQTETST